MRDRPRRPIALAAALVSLAALGCSGDRPTSTTEPQSMPSATDVRVAPAGVTESRGPSAAPSTATPSGLESAAPTSAAPQTARPTAPAVARSTAAPLQPSTEPGTVTISLSAPVKVSATVHGTVSCDVGTAYHMETDVLVSGNEVFASVDIALYHGPGSYRATVSLEVSTPNQTQGGALPGVGVSISSATSGSAQYSYSGAGGSVAGTVAWVCSTNG